MYNDTPDAMTIDMMTIDTTTNGTMTNDAIRRSTYPADRQTTGESAPNRTLTLLAGIGIGAALLYFLDPQQGTRRRALLRDKAAKALRIGGREAREHGEDLRNRAAGTVAELGGRLDDAPVTDEQLVARVRSELGHHVERARAIEVVADHGKVTLRGEVPIEEMDGVVSTVRGVRGVANVQSELRVASGELR